MKLINLILIIMFFFNTKFLSLKIDLNKILNHKNILDFVILTILLLSIIQVFFIIFCKNIVLYILWYIFFVFYLQLYLKLYFFFFSFCGCITSPRDFFFKFFDLKYAKIYIFLTDFLKKSSILLLFIVLYKIPLLLLPYIFFSFILDLDEFEVNFDQAFLGVIHGAPIYLTPEGKIKVDFYIKRLIFNYLTFYYNNSFKFKLYYPDDFEYINENDADDTLF